MLHTDPHKPSEAVGVSIASQLYKQTRINSFENSISFFSFCGPFTQEQFRVGWKKPFLKGIEVIDSLLG